MRLRWTGTTDTTIPGGYTVSPGGVIEVTHGTRQMLKDRELWVDADVPVDDRPTQEQLDELQALVDKLQELQNNPPERHDDPDLGAMQADQGKATLSTLESFATGGGPGEGVQLGPDGVEPAVTAPQGGDDDKKAQEPSQEGQSGDQTPTESQTATLPEPAPEKATEPPRSHHKKD